MDRTSKTGIMIISTGVIVAAMVYFRDAIVQIALALLLFVGIQALAHWMRRRLGFLPRWLTGAISVALVLSAVGSIGWFMADNIGEFAVHAGDYGARIDSLIGQAFRGLGLTGAPPTVSALLRDADANMLLGAVARGLQAVTSDALFILIYLGFIMASAPAFPKKLDLIFPNPAARANAADIITDIRKSMEKYLWVTTALGGLTSVVIYGALLVIGLENPLFWATLIFFLSFIPTIGPLLGTLAPILFALVQFDTLGPVGSVALAVGVSQFVVGNFVQPRITGDSLNLSALVVLLTLALWGALWGIAGAFLATPLTVMLMTLLAQFESTRWIAILLSADGKPRTFHREREGAAG